MQPVLNVIIFTYRDIYLLKSTGSQSVREKNSKDSHGMISHVGKLKGVVFDVYYCVVLFLYNLSNYRLSESLVMDKSFKMIILNLRLRIAFFLEHSKLFLV